MSEARRLLVATRNQGKLDELRELLAGCPCDLVSLPEIGIDTEVEETGSTLEENATLKATIYAQASGLWTVADDSGLEVDILGGEPGVRSSRYAGEGADDGDRNDYLLRRLAGHPVDLWTARFRCVMALVEPGGQAALFSGECRGRIISEPRGPNGFGYDPIFLLPDRGKTMAELDPDEKNLVSHRGKAARQAAAAIETICRGSV